MNSDALEGQMALFETPAEEKKKKPAARKAAEDKTLPAPVKQEKKKVIAGKRRESGKPAQKSRGNGEGAEQARPTSGQVPGGDVRLTANIREDLHVRLNIA
ncbi:MAG: hypothetical protein EG828_11320, partial [Deltaproteobacteria bacterium]|nr:hypothetical protein [Deltaproteobacteria bacterium]